MATQLEYLAEVANRDNVSLGLIPWGTIVDVFPSGGFDLYDDRTAIVGFPNGAQFFNDPSDVQPYLSMTKRLEALAVFDDVAQGELSKIADTYRARTN